MKRDEFLRVLEGLLERESNSLTGDLRLEQIENWDSLAVIGFIAAADEHLGKTVPAQKINACQTVDDLLNLFQDELQ